MQGADRSEDRRFSGVRRRGKVGRGERDEMCGWRRVKVVEGHRSSGVVEVCERAVRKGARCARVLGLVMEAADDTGSGGRVESLSGERQGGREDSKVVVDAAGVSENNGRWWQRRQRGEGGVAASCALWRRAAWVVSKEANERAGGAMGAMAIEVMAVGEERASRFLGESGRRRRALACERRG